MLQPGEKVLVVICNKVGGIRSLEELTADEDDVSGIVVTPPVALKLDELSSRQYHSSPTNSSVVYGLARISASALLNSDAA